MSVRNGRTAGWLLLTFTLPTKRASQRVEIWRKLQRYGTVPLGNSGYLLPNNPSNEERFQWLATAIRKYGGDASVVHVESIDNLSRAQLIGRFSEARTDRKSTRLNSSHEWISYAVFCLKKKKKTNRTTQSHNTRTMRC